MKVGKFRIIPKETKIWSINLQMNVSLDKDIIVKITNTVSINDYYVYGFMCEELFRHTIPGILEHKNREFGFNYSETKDFIKSRGMLDFYEQENDKEKEKKIST